MNRLRALVKETIMTNKESRREMTRNFIKKIVDNRSYDASADLKEMIKISKAVRKEAAMDRVEI